MPASESFAAGDGAGLSPQVSPGEPVSPKEEATAAPRQGDPVARYLILAVIGVILLFLLTVIFAMVFGFLSPPRAPRTLLEQSLSVYGSQAQSNSADVQTTAKYVGALIEARQLNKAQTVLDSALKAAKTDKSYLLVQQGALYFARADYGAALKAGRSAEKEASAELAARLAVLKEKGIRETAQDVRPASWSDAVNLQAESLVKSNDLKGALKAYDTYLGVSPTASDILAARGLLKAKLGDKSGAKADLQKALTFVPDYQPALDGLKQIGAGAK